MTNQSNPLRTAAIPRTTVFSLLSNECRRRALAYLATRESPVALDDLASVVASPDVAGDATDGPAAVRERVTVGLHHVHLPRLDDAGVVDYDPDANTVTAVNVAPLVPFLEDETA